MRRRLRDPAEGGCEMRRTRRLQMGRLYGAAVAAAAASGWEKKKWGGGLQLQMGEKKKKGAARVVKLEEWSGKK